MVAWLCGAAAAQGTFVEADAAVMWSVDGVGGLGWAVAELADIDGDGAMDVLTSAPGENTSEGAAYVYSGATGTLIWRLVEPGGQNQGWGIADAGDTDGDGVSDILSGSPRGQGPGFTYLFSGATGALLHTFASPALTLDSFGNAVAAAGDLNDDGYGDVAIGAPDDASAGFGAGRVYLYSGLDHSLIRAVDGPTVGGLFGSGLGPIGDVDGDGLPEVVVGARDDGANAAGRVYVISGADGSILRGPLEGDPTAAELGAFFVSGVGDVNADGVDDVYGGDYADGTSGYGSGKAYVFSGADGSRIHTFTGAAGDGLGCGRTARDMDGDGVWDIATGAYLSNDGATAAGKVLVFSGVDGALVRSFTSATPGETFGFDAVGLGDVDGDGDGDLLVGASNASRIYVMAGNASEPPVETGDTGAPPPPAETGDTGEPPTDDTDDDGCGGCSSSGGGGLGGVALALAVTRLRRRPWGNCLGRSASPPQRGRGWLEGLHTR
ncbi:MAG: integrin alpha [Myxococcota bacterium]